MSKGQHLTLQSILAVFRALANEHARKRAASEREHVWARVQLESISPERRWFRLGAPHSVWRLVAAAAVGAGAVTLVFVFGASSALRYELRGADPAGGLIRSDSNDAAVNFSDGSRIEMSKGAALAVEILGPHAARTRLNGGALDVSVQHRDDTDFRFLAGPYEVRVVGTKFHLDWQPQTGLFSVAMREGKVRIVGPDVDRFLSAGETLHVTSSLNSTPLARTDPPAPNGAAPVAPPPPAAPAPASASPIAPASADDPRAGRAASSWATLVAKGRFQEVVEAAEAIGLDDVLRERGAADLNALAHAANYTGHSSLALRTWSASRERFAGRRVAHQAAFFLSRVHERQGHAAEALRWLNVYLSEAPDDVYVPEALGRKLVLVQRLEGALAAERVARDYLQRFPRGAYAHTAQALLTEP